LLAFITIHINNIMRYGFAATFAVIALLLPSLAAAQKASVTRDLPVEVSLNGQFTYTINIGINAGGPPVALGIEETLPKGWQLVSVNTTYAKANASANTFYWLFGPAVIGLPPVQDATIMLTTTPANQNGSFSGYWYADDEEGFIGGDNATIVAAARQDGNGGGGGGGGGTSGGGFGAGIAGTFCLSGQTKPCGSNVGECRPGARSCLNGAWSAQCAGEVAPAAELCDHLDNDCNGVADNGITCECFITDRRACGSEIGACRPGRLSCDAGRWGTCGGAVGPFDEICGNGIDDDCDAFVDEAECIYEAKDICRDGAISSPCMCGNHTYTAGYCYSNEFSMQPRELFVWLPLILIGAGLVFWGVSVEMHWRKKRSRAGSRVQPVT